MAKVTIDIFFVTAQGFEGHVGLEPGEGESGLALLGSASAGLEKMGCLPRPVKSFGGGGGNRKQAEPAPGKACPKCNGPVTAKSGKRQDGSNYSGFACMKPREACGGWLNA